MRDGMKERDDRYYNRKVWYNRLRLSRIEYCDGLFGTNHYRDIKIQERLSLRPRVKAMKEVVILDPGKNWISLSHREVVDYMKNKLD